MNYLALLRGINVGGNNVIKKEDLKQCFENAGFSKVKTYIQSGNILFESSEKDVPKIKEKIEKGLKKYLKNHIITLVLSEEEYRKTLKSAPKDWGKKEDYKYNALFFTEELSKKEITEALPAAKKEAHEETTVTPKAIFWSAPKSHYSKTAYSQELVKSKIYKKVTIRNSNTSFKLLELFNEL